MTKIAVLISGRGSNFKALLEASLLGTLNGTITAVVSNNKDAAGLDVAREHDIATHVLEPRPNESRVAYDQRLIRLLDQINADWLALAGFMRILGPELVSRYIGKLVNIHPSLLPAYIGLNTHERVINAGEQFHGATVHFVTEELDGGPIISQQSLEIQPKDTPESLAYRVLQIEHQLYPRALQLCINGHARYEKGECYLDATHGNASTLSDETPNG